MSEWEILLGPAFNGYGDQRRLAREHRERREALRTELDAAFLARRMRGETYEQIGARFDVSRQQARNRVARAVADHRSRLLATIGAVDWGDPVPPAAGHDG